MDEINPESPRAAVTTAVVVASADVASAGGARVKCGTGAHREHEAC
jgi:hypothetical protein